MHEKIENPLVFTTNAAYMCDAYTHTHTRANARRTATLTAFAFSCEYFFDFILFRILLLLLSLHSIFFCHSSPSIALPSHEHGGYLFRIPNLAEHIYFDVKDNGQKKLSTPFVAMALSSRISSTFWRMQNVGARMPILPFLTTKL